MGAGYGFWASESREEHFQKRRRRDRRQPGASKNNKRLQIFICLETFLRLTPSVSRKVFPYNLNWVNIKFELLL